MVLGKGSLDFLSLVPMQLTYKVCQENFVNLELLQLLCVCVGCVPCSAVHSQHDIRQVWLSFSKKTKKRVQCKVFWVKNCSVCSAIAFCTLAQKSGWLLYRDVAILGVLQHLNHKRDLQIGREATHLGTSVLVNLQCFQRHLEKEILVSILISWLDYK